MGFEKMRGLSADAFIAETRRRQAEAGRYAAEKRKTNHPPELREKARQMAAEGVTQAEIARQLSEQAGTKVSQQSVSRWLKA